MDRLSCHFIFSSILTSITLSPSKIIEHNYLLLLSAACSESQVPSSGSRTGTKINKENIPRGIPSALDTGWPVGNQSTEGAYLAHSFYLLLLECNVLDSLIACENQSGGPVLVKCAHRPGKEIGQVNNPFPGVTRRTFPR